MSIYPKIATWSYVRAISIIFLLAIHSTPYGGQLEGPSGYWKVSCEDMASGGFLDFRADASKMEVNPNQILISVNSHRAEPGRFSLYLSEPLDLGAGGMRLSWDRFSSETPIATFVILDDARARFKWYGFWHIDMNTYVWSDEHAFVQQTTERPVALTRCE